MGRPSTLHLRCNIDQEGAPVVAISKKMSSLTRRQLSVASILLMAAGCAPRDDRPPIPQAVGDWKLVSKEVTAPMARAKRAFAAQYTGTPAIEVELHEMSAGTLAFDTLQSWRPSKGKLAFYQGRYFGTASAPGAEHAVLNRFVTMFQRAMTTEFPNVGT